ncbi:MULTISPECIES: hypothetical protein [Mycobacterium]|uniref:hypothetical protein n=1 Tax=Mycobacterium TaxID=1763 RepID=UPI0018D2711D|nr:MULTISPECIES: hypothetical protein [Mycobacterium]MDP7728483.1 hypothetical protein [Mycobacterium sp. TY813]
MTIDPFAHDDTTSDPFACSCCQEQWPGTARDPIEVLGDPPYHIHIFRDPPLCRMCEGHQGAELVLKMEFEHAAEYRERLADTRKSRDRAVREGIILKKQLTAMERKCGKLLDQIKKATYLHRFKGDGTCICGREQRKCATCLVAEDPWIREQLRRQDQQGRADTA